MDRFKIRVTEHNQAKIRNFANKHNINPNGYVFYDINSCYGYSSKVGFDGNGDGSNEISFEEMVNLFEQPVQLTNDLFPIY
jgi:hypothetical protein